MENFSIADTHNDFLTELNEIDAKKYLNNVKNDSVCALGCSVFTSKILKQDIFEKIEKSKEILDHFGDLNFFLHIEDLAFLNTDLALKRLVSLSPFSCSLSWNNDNCLCGGNNGKSDLTQWGEYVAKTLNKNKIIIDLSHTNEKSFYSLAKLQSSPLFVSHTCFNFHKKTKRNLTDEQIELVKKSGGYIGLFFFKDCVESNGNYNIDEIIKIIIDFISRFGVDTLGFGTDFYGIKETPEGLTNYAKMQNLANKLKTKGLDNETIEKLFSKNFIKFKQKTALL